MTGDDGLSAEASHDYEKPTWANWIEDDERPHLVVGIECRTCVAGGLKWEKPVSPRAAGPEWRNIEHSEGCPHAE